MSLDPIDRTLLLPESGVAVVAPWLVIAPPGAQHVVRLDLRLLDRVEVVGGGSDADPPEVLLVCGGLEVGLAIADGSDAARRIAERAALHVGAATMVDLERSLLVDEDAVVLRDYFLHVGARAFRLDEVRDCALSGGNLRLTRGRVLQAAMALLVVAAGDSQKPE